MTHKMILLDTDLKTVKAVMIAKRKDAGMAEMDMHRLRTADDSSSNLDASPTFDLPFGHEDLTEIS